MHLELVNQSVCDNLLNPNPQIDRKFDQDVMICAGDVENGGRDICYVGHYCACHDLKQTQKTKIRVVSVQYLFRQWVIPEFIKFLYYRS